MSLYSSSANAVRSVHHASSSASSLCICFQSLSFQSRSLSSTTSRHAVKPLHAPSTSEQPAQKRPVFLPADVTGNVQAPAYMDMTPAQRAARAAERARERLQEQQKRYNANRQLGGLAGNSFFAEKDDAPELDRTQAAEAPAPALAQESGLSRRSVERMSLALNPRSDARGQWHRKMLIRHVRRRGRLPKVVQIARSERSHLSKSHFFKTSMKKLAPLARQIAGKSIDEAILQMRFSKKKAAVEVRAHLVQAKNEAIVVRGMGLGAVIPNPTSTTAESPVASDPGITPPEPHQNPTKSTKAGHQKDETNIYVAQAWVNRGPYGMVPEYRARGRVNILRPPSTGISVLLKEEKTRTRQKAEKEAKAIRKRLGKTMWVQLPDRPITRQSQYVLW